MIWFIRSDHDLQYVKMGPLIISLNCKNFILMCNLGSRMFWYNWLVHDSVFNLVRDVKNMYKECETSEALASLKFRGLQRWNFLMILVRKGGFFLASLKKPCSALPDYMYVRIYITNMPFVQCGNGHLLNINTVFSKIW